MDKQTAAIRYALRVFARSDLTPTAMVVAAYAVLRKVGDDDDQNLRVDASEVGLTASQITDAAIELSQAGLFNIKINIDRIEGVVP